VYKKTERNRMWPKTQAGKKVCESRKVPFSALSGKIVTFDLEGTVRGVNDNGDGECEGGVSVNWGSVTGGGLTLTKEEKEIEETENEQSNESESEPKYTRVSRYTT